MKAHSLYALIALLISSVTYAAEGTEVPTPVESTPVVDPAQDATMPSTGRSQVKKGGIQMRLSNKDKGASLNSKTKRAMPPAGSAATGGTSSSPGGVQTTPYGNPTN